MNPISIILSSPYLAPPLRIPLSPPLDMLFGPERLTPHNREIERWINSLRAQRSNEAIFETLKTIPRARITVSEWRESVHGKNLCSVFKEFCVKEYKQIFVWMHQELSKQPLTTREIDLISPMTFLFDVLNRSLEDKKMGEDLKDTPYVSCIGKTLYRCFQRGWIDD